MDKIENWLQLLLKLLILAENTVLSAEYMKAFGNYEWTEIYIGDMLNQDTY